MLAYADSQWSFLLATCHTEGNSGTNEITQGWLIEHIAFVDVNRARSLRLKPGVEEALRVTQ